MALACGSRIQCVHALVALEAKQPTEKEMVDISFSRDLGKDELWMEKG